MEAVTEQELVGLPYPGLLAVSLRSAGVGLWDVIAQARRIGSLDARIRDHSPNALAGLAATLPRLRAIAFNGAKALGHRAKATGRRGWTRDDHPAPPAASAYAAMPFATKREAWLRLKGFLKKG